jgi:phosphoglycerate dehydrogenase-like enzyme
MSTLLLSHSVASASGAEIERRCRDRGEQIEVIGLPEDPDGRLPVEVCARLDAAFFSPDVNPRYSRQFFSAVRKAPKLEWLHVYNVGVDHPIYTEMLERGVRVTTSAGTTAVPIAQTAICGLLMLARNLPRWLAAQRERKWEPMRGTDVPRDLDGQTAVIFGLGNIGREIARLAKALGLTVIGVRRSPLTAEDPVDELYPPERLAELLPRADWLIIAAPLTPQTQGLLTAELMAKLPPEARLINIARGEIVDERALAEALGNGRLAGAYLDVFEKEPLPEDSPLWDMPNVVVSPHNSGAASGNDRRVYDIFLENLDRWQRGAALLNEVARKTC